MIDWRSLRADLYSPRVLGELAVGMGSEVAHALPFPDPVAWLLSGPLITVPLGMIAIAYATGYIVTIEGLKVVEKSLVRAERVWDAHVHKWYVDVVPESVREWVPRVEVEAWVAERELEYETELYAKELEVRGSAQVNEIKGRGNDETFRK